MDVASRGIADGDWSPTDGKSAEMKPMAVHASLLMKNFRFVRFVGHVKHLSGASGLLVVLLGCSGQPERNGVQCTDCLVCCGHLHFDRDQIIVDDS